MSSGVKVYIVEDEAITRATIKSHLVSVGYEVVGMSDEAEEAWEELKQNEDVDLVLIDINLLGEKDGIWLAKQLFGLCTMAFVFLTAYTDKNTVGEALSFKPDGYLIKPFQEMDLYSAIEIAMESFTNRKKLSTPKKDTMSKYLFVKDDHVFTKIEIDEIQYVKSDGNYLEVHLSNKNHVVRSKLDDFGDQLPADKFVKVHQRYLINVGYIETIGTAQVTLNGTEIPISKTYKSQLLELINTI